MVSPKIPSLLDQLSTDLTALAQEGKLDPVIGRDNEIEQLIEILCSDENKAPLLIGSRGIGKTAIVGGLAQRITTGAVPTTLRTKRLRQLDLGSLVHMAQSRQMDEPTKRLLWEARRPDSILLVEDLDDFDKFLGQPFIGYLIPAIQNAEIQCVAATCMIEIANWQDVSPALERAFHPLYVRELSIEESISALRAGRKPYEDYHQLKITDEAINAAVKLSARFVTDRGALPGKAFDLIDEGAARLRMSASALLRKRRVEQELADIDDELEALSAEMTEEARHELIQRKNQLIVELPILQTKAKTEPDVLLLDAHHIAEVVALWTGRPLAEIADTNQIEGHSS